jgi:hypothetical protein
MNGRERRATALAARRKALVALSELQRQTLGERALALAAPLVWVDRTHRVLRRARANPWLVIVPAAAIALLRPRWVLRAAPAAIALMRLGSRLR